MFAEALAQSVREGRVPPGDSDVQYSGAERLCEAKKSRA